MASSSRRQESKGSPLKPYISEAFGEPEKLSFVLSEQSKEFFEAANDEQGFATIAWRKPGTTEVHICLVPAFNKDDKKPRTDKYGNAGDEDGKSGEKGRFVYVKSDEPLGKNTGIIHRKALEYLKKTKQIPDDLPPEYIIGAGVWKGDENKLVSDFRMNSASLNFNAIKWDKKFLSAFWFLDQDNVDGYKLNTRATKIPHYFILRTLPGEIGKEIYLALMKQLPTQHPDTQRASSRITVHTEERYPLSGDFDFESVAYKWWTKNSENRYLVNLKILANSHIAAREGQHDVLENMLKQLESNDAEEKNAILSLNKRLSDDTRNTMLINAVLSHSPKTVEVVLKRDVSLTRKNNQGKTSLVIAVEKEFNAEEKAENPKRINLKNLIFKKNERENFNLKKIKIIKSLLKAYKKVPNDNSEKIMDFIQAILLAVKANDGVIVKMLIDGIKPIHLDKKTNEETSQLQLAIHYTLGDNVDSYDPTTCFFNLFNKMKEAFPSHANEFSKKLNEFEILFWGKLNTQEKNERLMKTVYIAAKENNADLMKKILLEIDKNYQSSGDPDDVIKVKKSSLLDKIFSGKTKNTALMDAVLSGSIEAVEVLLNHGASLSKKNSYGKNAMMLALEAGKDDIFRLLFSFFYKKEKADIKNAVFLEIYPKITSESLSELVMKDMASEQFSIENDAQFQLAMLYGFPQDFPQYPNEYYSPLQNQPDFAKSTWEDFGDSKALCFDIGSLSVIHGLLKQQDFKGLTKQIEFRAKALWDKKNVEEKNNHLLKIARIALEENNIEIVKKSLEEIDLNLKEKRSALTPENEEELLNLIFSAAGQGKIHIVDLLKQFLLDNFSEKYQPGSSGRNDLIIIIVKSGNLSSAGSLLGTSDINEIFFKFFDLLQKEPKQIAENAIGTAFTNACKIGNPSTVIAFINAFHTLEDNGMRIVNNSICEFTRFFKEKVVQTQEATEDQIVIILKKITSVLNMSTEQLKLYGISWTDSLGLEFIKHCFNILVEKNNVAIAKILLQFDYPETLVHYVRDMIQWPERHASTEMKELVKGIKEHKTEVSPASNPHALFTSGASEQSSSQPTLENKSLENKH